MMTTLILFLLLTAVTTIALRRDLARSRILSYDVRTMMTTLILFLLLTAVTTIALRRDLARSRILSYDVVRNAWCSRAGVVRVTDEDLARDLATIRIQARAGLQVEADLEHARRDPLAATLRHGIA